MKKAVLLTIVAFLAASALNVGAQRSAPAARTDKTTLQAEQLLPMTCLQAWVTANKSYPEMLAIVKTLARVSLLNRDLTLPDTREAGVEAGKGIADDCKADPDSLLFAVVDKHVRRVAMPASH